MQDGIYLIPCHVAVCFALEDLNNRMNCTRMSCKKKMYILTLFFKIVLGKIASVARNYINAATQTSLRSPFPFLLFISFFYVLIPCYRMFFLNLYVLPYTSTYCRIKCSFCEIFSYIFFSSFWFLSFKIGRKKIEKIAFYYDFEVLCCLGRIANIFANS